MKNTPRRLLVAAILVIPLVAFAHPGHEEPTFPLGIRHPFIGVDHLLAMLAVGLWAAQLGGRARFVLPAALVGGMALGGALQSLGVMLPQVEGAIVATVLVLGCAVALVKSLWTPTAAALVALSGCFHGFAHATEIPAGGSLVAFGAGVLVATAALLGGGLALGAAAQRAKKSNWVRIAGGVIAGAGVALAVV